MRKVVGEADPGTSQTGSGELEPEDSYALVAGQGREQVVSGLVVDFWTRVAFQVLQNLGKFLILPQILPQ